MGEYNKVPPQEHEMKSYPTPVGDDPVVSMKPPKPHLPTSNLASTHPSPLNEFTDTTLLNFKEKLTHLLPSKGEPLLDESEINLMRALSKVSESEEPDFEDGRKEQRKSAKEVRISVSILILTFLASACIVFGTLFPELSRGEVDMRPFRDAMYAIKRMSPHLVKDRITLVNLGLWRYCYDDQLYDLIEIINPGGFSGYKKKRDVSKNSEELDIVKREAEHSIVKRQKTREGDLSIRCHPVPAPWKMPYHVKYKQEIVKVTLLIGIVACVVSFLVSILVLITRLPLLKIFLVLVCLISAVSIGTALGVAMTMADDAEKYFNEAIGRKTEMQISEEMGISLRSLGINLEGMNLVEMAPGVSSVFIAVSCIFMLLSVVLSVLSIGVAVGAAFSMWEDGEIYINRRVISDKIEAGLNELLEGGRDPIIEKLGLDILALGIHIGPDKIINLELGISAVLILIALFLMVVNVVLAAISIGTACGVAVTMKADAEWYFNEAMGRKMHEFIYEELGFDVVQAGIQLKGTNLIKMEVGVSAVFIGCSALLMLFSFVLAELSRNFFSK